MACAALLHDTVEDHYADIAPGGGREDALAVLAGRFGGRVAGLVGAVTNPDWEPGRDRDEQYREHVAVSLGASPWARVVKVSDLTDNAVGLFHTSGPSLPGRAAKYRPLLPVLRELVLRPDTPLQDDVKRMIAAQLDRADGRLAAICGGPDSAVGRPGAGDGTGAAAPGRGGIAVTAAGELESARTTAAAGSVFDARGLAIS